MFKWSPAAKNAMLLNDVVHSLVHVNHVSPARVNFQVCIPNPITVLTALFQTA